MSSPPPNRSAFFGACTALSFIALLLICAYYVLLPAAGYQLQTVEPEGEPTGFTLDFSTSTPTPFARATPASKPKNLVILIGDGMGFSQLTGARMALEGPNGRLTLERFPITGWSATHSKSEVYTDSAAGATALATGNKTDPGRISTDSSGKPLDTLFDRARAEGLALGLITDSYAYDATPAAFGAHRDSRRDYLGIAEDMLALRPEVLIGETRSEWNEDSQWQALFAAYEASGYLRLRTTDELTDAPSEQSVLGLFPKGTIAPAEQAPGLAELTTFALDRLRTSEKGFVLLVETEETDTASHRGDFDRMVRGIQSLDRVARVVIDFASADGETLVVATADHETGGLAILGGEHGGSQIVRWTTDSHSAEPVPVLAFGPGSEAFTGVHDNAEIGKLLAGALLHNDAAEPAPAGTP